MSPSCSQARAPRPDIQTTGTWRSRGSAGTNASGGKWNRKLRETILNMAGRRAWRGCSSRVACPPYSCIPQHASAPEHAPCSRVTGSSFSSAHSPAPKSAWSYQVIGFTCSCSCTANPSHTEVWPGAASAQGKDGGSLDAMGKFTTHQLGHWRTDEGLNSAKFCVRLSTCDLNVSLHDIVSHASTKISQTINN